MRLPALAFLIAATSLAPAHAAEPARGPDSAPVASTVPAQPRPASKNAFGQAMAELARGLREAKPAGAAATRAAPKSAPAKTAPAVASATPPPGG